MTSRAAVVTSTLLAAAALAAHGIAFATAGDTRVWAVNAGWTLAGLVAVGGTVAAAVKVGGGRVRLAWLLWAAAAGFWLAGALVRDGIALAGASSGTPSAADVLWWLFALFAAAGLAFRAPPGSFSARLYVLDALPIVIAITAIARITAAEHIGDNVGQDLFLSLYAALGTLPVLLAIPLLMLDRRASSNMWLLTPAFALASLAGAVWPHAVLENGPAHGHWTDLLWTICLLGLGAGALRRAFAPSGHTRLFPAEKEGGFRALAPASSIVALFVMDIFVQERFDESLYWLTFAAIVPLVARFYLVRRSMGRLLGDLTLSRRTLEKSERRFRSLFASAATGMSIVDAGGRVLASNAALQEMLGYPEDELVSLGAHRHPEDAAASLDLWEELRAGGRDSFQLEERYLRKGGAIAWGHLTVSRVLDSGGELYLAMLEDVTKRKRTEEALRAVVEGTAGASGEEFFRVLVRNLAVALGVRYAFVGKLLEGPHEAIRTLALWTGSDFGENVEYLLAGTPCENVVGKDLCSYPRNLQELFPKDEMLVEIGAESYLGIPLIGSDGRAFGILATLHDEPGSTSPTEESILRVFAARASAELQRLEARDALRRSERRLRSVFESAAIGIAVSTVDGRMVEANRRLAEMLGYDRHELPGMTVAELTHPDDVATNSELFGELVEGKRSSFQWEKRYLHRDGGVVWGRATVSLVRDAEGEPELVTAMVEDVTEQRQAEERLREAEERYRTLVERLPLATYVEHLDESSATYISPQIESLIGYSAEEWMADRSFFAKVLHPEDRERVIAGFARLQETGEPFECEYRLIARDGRVVWFRDGAVVVRDKAGRPLHAQGYMIDITGRKQVEDALRDSEQRFRAIADSAPVLIFTADADGAFTYVSQGWEDLTGLAVEKHLGFGWEQAVHPDDLAGVNEAFLTAARNGDSYEVEYRLRAADGSYRTMNERGSPLFLADGSPAGIVAVVVDTTERRQAEEEILKTTTLLSALIENLHSGILVEDESRRLSYVNHVLCADFGITAPPAALVGTDWALAAEEVGSLFVDAERWIERIEEILAGCGRVRGEELELVDGRVFERDYMPIQAGDSYRGHLWQYRDITERKRVERELNDQNEQLRAMDKVKDEFVALVSHELRTPLTSILGYLELVLDDEGELSDEQRQFLAVVERNAQRLLRLVGDLLFVAQIEAGKLAFELDKVDLARIAADCVEAQRPRARAKGVEIALAADETPALEGDRARLAQLLDNLVSNAIKFTLEGGEVKLKLERGEGCVLLEVSDSGIGIPAGEQSRLFQRFFRASTATTREIQGTGLGLTITKAIVEGHGGRIWFESEEGAGTTFHVQLPLAHGAAGDSEEASSASVEEMAA